MAQRAQHSGQHAAIPAEFLIDLSVRGQLASLIRATLTALRGSAVAALLSFHGLAAATQSASESKLPLSERVRACVGCHGEQGRAGPDGYYPRLAGKPSGYLYSQLQHFAEGRRQHAAMQRLLVTLDDPTLKAFADYFASLTLAYPAPPASRAAAEQLQRGRTLALVGDPSGKLPACASCHGQSLTGVSPDVPGLLGLSPDYLNAQLGAWRTGLRQAHAPDCMAEIARRLIGSDLSAVTAWLASQPVPDQGRPQPAPSAARSGDDLRCGASPPLPEVRPMPGAGEPPLARGEILARAGNCVACHTDRGRPLMSGARPIDTPFGVVFSSNLTPDADTGLGRWSAADFWNALHRGRSRDGRRLAPAFPYDHTTLITREDSDAIYAWLQTVPAVRAPQPAHQLTWPFGTQPALAVWQFLFFKPASFAPEPGRDELWNRGAYLVEAVGHCAACHGPRNVLGATRSVKNLSGSTMPGSAWIAPSLLDDGETGLASTPLEEIIQLLRTGRAVHASTLGPMAGVVQHGLQYLAERDLLAIASYLQSRAREQTPRPAAAREGTRSNTGAEVYRNACADCHGDSGEGSPGRYPALRGNRAVLHANPANTVLAVLHGGYTPVTAGNPAPPGMPPFALALSSAEIAAVVTWIRGGLQAAGSTAAPVSAPLVERVRNRSR